MDTHDPELKEKANTLYWESDESVNEIADALELSKGSLYALVEARPTDQPCPECGATLEFPNRTARDKGLVTCPECELEEELALVRAAALEDSGLLVGEEQEVAVPARVAVAAGLIGLALGILIGRGSRDG
jgi:transposase-like protein